MNYKFLILSFILMVTPMTILANQLEQERQQVIKTYMSLLNKGQYAEMEKLFTIDGIVDSPPVKGSIPSSEKFSASKFYQMAAQQQFFIKVKIKDIFVSVHYPNKIAVHLIYEVVGETPVTPRSAIDIFEFKPNSTKIKLLTAIVNK